MVSKRLKVFLLLALLTLVVIALGPWILPRAIAAIPGPYRQRLPHQLLQLITTPLPTSLPAPAADVSQADAAMPGIIFPVATVLQETPTTIPTPTPTPILKPTIASGMTEKATATAMVTSTPTPTATTTPAPTPTPTSTRLPTAAQIDGLENVPQKFNNCGPSNLSIALSFFGYEAHQLDIAAILRPNYDDRNVSPGELIRYVNERTPLRASVYSGGDLNTLKRLIAAGIPVTIEKGLIPNERDGWMGHYLTLFAYDDAVQEFYSMDTYLGPWDGSGRAESYETVQRYWGHFNYTFFVVFTGEMQARVEEALGPTLLDPMAMWQAAGLKANVEIQSEDENAFAWFNLGTSLTQLGQLTGQQVYFNNAVVAYDRAREIGLPPRMLWYQFEPYIAYLEAGRIDDVLDLTSATMIGGGWDVEETHLYRGHALRAKGDEAGARAAYRQALQINPNFQAAQEALE